MATATRELAETTKESLQFGQRQAELAHGCKLEMALTAAGHLNGNPITALDLHVHVTNHGPGLATLVEYGFERGPFIHAWPYESVLPKGGEIKRVQRVQDEAVKDVMMHGDPVPVFGRWVRWTDELGSRWEWAHAPGPRPATTRKLDPSEPWSRVMKDG